jgi:hypothetical protein
MILGCYLNSFERFHICENDKGIAYQHDIYGDSRNLAFAVAAEYKVRHTAAYPLVATDLTSYILPHGIYFSAHSKTATFRISKQFRIMCSKKKLTMIRRLRKIVKSDHKPRQVCPFVRASIWNKSAPNEQILMKFDI